MKIYGLGKNRNMLWAVVEIRNWLQVAVDSDLTGKQKTPDQFLHLSSPSLPPINNPTSWNTINQALGQSIHWTVYFSLHQ